MDEHLPLIQCRVAAVLCAWGGRSKVAPDDWRLARMIVETSCRVRGAAIATAAEMEAEKRHRLSVERGQSAQIVRLHTGRAEADCERVAAIVARRVHKLQTAKWRDLVHSIKDRDRHLLREAVEFALAAGWIVEQADQYMAGASRPVE